MKSSLSNRVQILHVNALVIKMCCLDQELESSNQQDRPWCCNQITLNSACEFSRHLDNVYSTFTVRTAYNMAYFSKQNQRTFTDSWWRARDHDDSCAAPCERNCNIDSEKSQKCPVFKAFISCRHRIRHPKTSSAGFFELELDLVYHDVI